MKQVEKISLACLKSKLTRNEMKNVMAGSGSSGSTDCADSAAKRTNLHEQADHDWYGYCYTSEQYNAMYNYYYAACVTG
jgi:hypothetical protein